MYTSLYDPKIVWSKCTESEETTSIYNLLCNLQKYNFMLQRFLNIYSSGAIVLDNKTFYLGYL